MDEGCKNHLDHMTNMAAMPIYGKTFTNLLVQNREFYDLETWHAASGTQTQVCINGDPGLTLTYFTARSNLVACLFEWEKLLQSNLWGKLAANYQINRRFIFLKYF